MSANDPVQTLVCDVSILNLRDACCRGRKKMSLQMEAQTLFLDGDVRISWLFAEQKLYANSYRPKLI